jgi:hypothetical protein
MPRSKEQIKDPDSFMKEPRFFMEVRKYAHENGWEQEEQGSYVLFTKGDQDYKAVMFRTTGMIQCYYLGYGHQQETEHLNHFDSPEAVFEYVEKHRDMVLVKQHHKEEYENFPIDPEEFLQEDNSLRLIDLIFLVGQ